MEGRSKDLQRFISGEAGRNVSMMDDNLRAIENFVRAAARAGIISVYRPIDAGERRLLEKTEKDEIANAYHVELEGSDKVYYITYKPQVEKGGKSSGKLEHVNRSTPFIQMLLEKIAGEYSFLYCQSRTRSNEIYELPAVSGGFTCTAGEAEHTEGKNKYELFFLIECKDNIDTNERLTNIIDSVLIDVDGKSGDFFADMTYAPLEHAESDDDYSQPVIDPEVRRQLNKIILQIRESKEVRTRILDFLAGNELSDLGRHMSRRNEAFKAVREAGEREINALNSTVTCRMMPFGVFLNSVDTDRITYTVTGKGGAKATFTEEFNALEQAVHRCPHCGAPLTARNGIVLAHTEQGYEVGCLSCAKKCTRKGCERYVFTGDGCAVCGKILCPEHSRKSMDSGDRLCPECAKVFCDYVSGSPLSPRDAAVRGEQENFVESEVARFGKTGALNYFKGEKLLRKKECVRCKTRSGYRYYRASETAKCDKCGDSFYEADVKTADSGENLCYQHRVDCSCGKVVPEERAHKCAEKTCEHGFCDECYARAARPSEYYYSAQAVSGRKIKAVHTAGKVYCNRHVKVCKVCGKPFPNKEMRLCRECGGYYCPDCGSQLMCKTCSDALKVTPQNFKEISSPTRKYRINALPYKERRVSAVFEDYETVIYVTLGVRRKVRVYNKVTEKTTEK